MTGRPEAHAEGVRVPTALCWPVGALLTRALLQESQRDGGMVLTPALKDFLQELMAADASAVADDGHDHDPSDTIAGETGDGSLTVAQLAEQSGFPPRTLRRWAASGKVRARRAGTVWLIDPESLKQP